MKKFLTTLTTNDTTTWVSPAPQQCDLCAGPLPSIFVDGKTTSGPWAIMCPDCHAERGMGFGTGLGQEFTLTDDNKWIKTK